MGNSILASRVCLDINSWVEGFKHDFYLNFIKDDRYMYLLKGLWMTLQITFFAVLIGIALGVVAAIVRSTHDKIIDEMRPGLRKFLLKFFNAIVKIYLTVIRGTPVVVQLLIMYYVIFASSTNQILIAVLAFGINSGAYVAEIFRSGIMSIDNGQFEAGRSLGFNYIQTMIHIIIPQAFKNVLPALANELSDKAGKTIGSDIPLHISRFFPRFHMTDRSATPVKDVYALAEIAREKLNFVYTGNC